MRKITISVTQEDIEIARRELPQTGLDARFCPVARALSRALGLQLGNVRIGHNVIEVYAVASLFPTEYAEIPGAVRQRISQFDRTYTYEMEPFRLTAEFYENDELELLVLKG